MVAGSGMMKLNKSTGIILICLVLILSIIFILRRDEKIMDKKIEERTLVEYEFEKNGSIRNGLIKDEILSFLILELNQKNDVAERLYKDLATNEDLLKEFYTWLQTRRYPKEEEGAIVVAGYTAEKLAEMTRGKLTAFGVYNYMTSLREKPEETIHFIKSHLMSSKERVEEFYKYYDLSNKGKKKNYITGIIPKDKVAQIKRDFLNYMTIDMNQWDIVAEHWYEDFSRHEDILKECHTWIKTKHFPYEKEGAIVVRGYTAGKIAEVGKGAMESIRAYRYLMNLRENPEDTLKDLKRLYDEDVIY